MTFRYASSAGTPSRKLLPIREQQDKAARAAALADLEVTRAAYNRQAQALGYPPIPPLELRSPDTLRPLLSQGGHNAQPISGSKRGRTQC